MVYGNVDFYYRKEQREGPHRCPQLSAILKLLRPKPKYEQALVRREYVVLLCGRIVKSVRCTCALGVFSDRCFVVTYEGFKDGVLFEEKEQVTGYTLQMRGWQVFKQTGTIEEL